MQLDESLNRRTRSSHRHHFKNGLLCTVIRVLSTAFALCNPHVFVLHIYCIVHIFGQSSAGRQHLSHRQIALDNKRFVDSHEVFYPRKRQQVVADSYLTGRREARIYE